MTKFSPSRFKYRSLYFEFHIILYIHCTFVRTHAHCAVQMLGGYSEVDPDVLFTKQEKIGKGSFGEVFKG